MPHSNSSTPIVAEFDSQRYDGGQLDVAFSVHEEFGRQERIAEEEYYADEGGSDYEIDSADEEAFNDDEEGVHAILLRLKAGLERLQSQQSVPPPPGLPLPPSGDINGPLQLVEKAIAANSRASVDNEQSKRPFLQVPFFFDEIDVEGAETGIGSRSGTSASEYGGPAVVEHDQANGAHREGITFVGDLSSGTTTTGSRSSAISPVFTDPDVNVPRQEGSIKVPNASKARAARSSTRISIPSVRAPRGHTPARSSPLRREASAAVSATPPVLRLYHDPRVEVRLLGDPDARLWRDGTAMYVTCDDVNPAVVCVYIRGAAETQADGWHTEKRKKMGRRLVVKTGSVRPAVAPTQGQDALAASLQKARMASGQAE